MQTLTYQITTNFNKTFTIDAIQYNLLINDIYVPIPSLGTDITINDVSIITQIVTDVSTVVVYGDQIDTIEGRAYRKDIIDKISVLNTSIANISGFSTEYSINLLKDMRETLTAELEQVETKNKLTKI
jgi:hypothetical protein